MKKVKSFGIAALILLWAVLSLTLWFGRSNDYTYSERRPLAQMPQLSVSNVFSGKFASDFEKFTLDQFPLRDTVRKVKSIFHYYVLNQSDNNGIYLVDDTVAKVEYPLNESSVAYATGKLQLLHDTLLQNTDCKIYATLIPDKGYFLARENGYPALDYTAMEQAYREAMPWASYADIKDLLTARDYYRTDTHWRQEKILPVAQALCGAMGVAQPEETAYFCQQVDVPFYGVYYGQAALPMEPEALYILKSTLLDGCTVTDPITGTVTPIYNLEKSTSPDLYDVFLSGAQPLLVIDNPQGEPGRELVMFRDSYSSSLAPLLLQGYSKVTLVDIRYLPADQVAQYVTFENQDVLFAYSTLILNNGRSLK